MAYPHIKYPQKLEVTVMAKKIVPLTDIKIKAIKPQTVAKKVFDGGGLSCLSPLPAANCGT